MVPTDSASISYNVVDFFLNFFSIIFDRISVPNGPKSRRKSSHLKLFIGQ